MIKELIVVVLFLFLLSNVYALCEDGQININTASAEKLDELYGIGTVKAQEIINSRPFDSVNDLLNVNGIGEATLNKINEQGLACVDKETTNQKEDEQTEIINETKDGGNLELIDSTDDINKSPEKVELTSINLNAKSIKSEDNKEILKRNWALYGIITFCVIFGALFLLKGRKYKNEFQ